MGTAHYLETTVQNVSDGDTGVAMATQWLNDCIENIDIADVESTEYESEVRIQFVLRMSDEDVERVKDSDGFQYLGSE